MSYFTSEQVRKGHPDKIADYISDSILDAYLEQDKYSKVACETLVTKNTVVISGEITSIANVDIDKIVRECIYDLGYYYDDNGFKYDTVEIINKLHMQSPDILMGVENDGAGDQGIMFGYACDDTKEYMPLAISICNTIVDYLDNCKIRELMPDGKCQVTINEDDNTVDTIVISVQHKSDINTFYLRSKIIGELIPILENKYGKIFNDSKILFNPTGRFVIGGPDGDTGLTGRKIVCDSYGGYCPVGGGAFSGKDYTKVDRSAAYAARWLAKNVVASGMVHKCLIQLSYAIGVPEPVSIKVSTDRECYNKRIENCIKTNIDLSPRAIKERFGLDSPIYSKTSNGGHFGRDFTWERLDIKDLFKGI